jgi:TonB family protein
MISDMDMEVVHFDDQLKYPALARQARIQGAVVVKVKLDAKGAVVDAAAISGSPMLIPNCLTNAKNWRFQPSSQKAAIMVSRWRIFNTIRAFRRPYAITTKSFMRTVKA